MVSENVKMMNKNCTVSIMELARVLKREIDAELVGEISRTFQSAVVVLLSFERYYFRIGGYATLTMMLVEQDAIQSVDMIGSGGGQGVTNISWGSNKSIVNKAIKELEKYGFELDL